MKIINKYSQVFFWRSRDVYRALSNGDVVSRKLVIHQEERVSPVLIPDVPVQEKNSVIWRAF